MGDMLSTLRLNRCVLFDWGDTLMRVFPEYDGPMFACPRVEAVAHAAEVAAALRPWALLAIATNAADSEAAEIWAALERGGLHTLLDKVYCYRQIGRKKPSKEFFDYILADLALEQPQVIMVGDDFQADVVGANACGIQAIWYNPHTPDEQAGPLIQTIHDLRALPAALQSFWKLTGA